MFGNNCGCGHNNMGGHKTGKGGDNCCLIILLLLLCGCNGFGEDNCCWNIILILLLLNCCGCGTGIGF